MLESITKREMEAIINLDIEKGITLIAIKVENESYLMYIPNATKWRRVNNKPVSKEIVEHEEREVLWI